jgi:hypothetical protein
MNRTEDLTIMRTALLDAIGEADPKTLSSLCRELRAVNAEIDTLAPTKNADQIALDELRERRAARRTATAD